MGPYEINNWVNSKKNFSTAIIPNPTGTFSIAGKVPIELTKEVASGFTTTRVSVAFKTEADAVEALLGIGVTKFQLSDCSWYGEE